MKKVFIILGILISFGIYRDIQNIDRKRTYVVVNQWVCYKSNPTAALHKIAWENAIHELPNIKKIPYLGNKPIESLFDWSDTIKIPYSQQAVIFFKGKWPGDIKDEICMYIDPYPTHCNIFETCFWWPLAIILKPFAHIIDPYLKLPIL